MQSVVDGDLGIEVDGVCHLPAVEKEPRSHLIALSRHSLLSSHGISHLKAGPT